MYPTPTPLYVPEQLESLREVRLARFRVEALTDKTCRPSFALFMVSFAAHEILNHVQFVF